MSDQNPVFNPVSTLNAHKALTQLYRWYQLYEREITDQNIANQMDILHEDLHLKTAAGELKGRANYPERLSAYKGWLNAHHVQNAEVVETGNGNILLEANIKYHNVRPDGSKYAYSISYKTELKNNETPYPEFTKIEIAPTGELNEEYKDAYPQNRVKSLLHAWLTNMEMISVDPAPFMELLTSDFQLHFTSGLVDSEEKLDEWLNGAPTSLNQSSHHPQKMQITKCSETEFELDVEFDWHGITKTNQNMQARTKHHWKIENDPSERFARIKEMHVIALAPFRLV